jgi:hypothetical protein
VLSAEAAAGGAFVAGCVTGLCVTVLRPQCWAGPIKHIQHIACIWHSDVDADEVTKEAICILYTHFCIQSTNIGLSEYSLWLLPFLDMDPRAHGLFLGQAGFLRKPGCEIDGDV